MSISEKIISTLEIGSKLDKKMYSEDQMTRFAKNAMDGALGAFLIPILIIAPFHYAPKAKKSSNMETVEKAKRAEKIGLFYIACWAFLMIYIFANN